MRLIYSLFFLFSLVSSPSLAMSKNSNDHKMQVFIVRVENELMPSSFSDVDDWYKSILDRVTLSSNLEKGENNPNSMLHIYRTVFHGFSAQLSPEQAESIKAQPEVVKVFPDQLYQVHTTRTPLFLGLNSYHSPKGLLKASDLGSNVVIGMFDTGIWPESPSFSDKGLGPVPTHFKGKCEGGKDFPSSLCNKKLVGARYFNKGFKAKMGTCNADDSARDPIGHGTHTGSTAAGGSLPSNTSFFGYAKGEATGIAPKARLAIYRVCWELGCVKSDILAAYDQAVQDGVNIISMSLGGETVQYASDPVSIGAFGAVEKGIFVSASGGNSGPKPKSVINVSPWMTTIGASTIDRTFPADLILGNGEVLRGTSLYTGKPFGEKEYYPLVHGLSNPSTSLCLPSILDPKLVKGKIVICYIGLISRVLKGVHVKNSGGVGVVVVNGEANGEALTSDSYLIPGLGIPNSATQKLFKYYNTTKNPNATIVFHGTKLGIGFRPAPAVAGFSSRGPNPISSYVLKPDIIAPGVDILAAWPDYVPPSRLPPDMDPRKSDYNIVSGTSMSCPHVSGIAALLKGAHPDWSPAMIRSALMTTAYNHYSDGKPIVDQQTYKEATIWDTGSGHVDPEKANDPGLVYDITTEDYIDFLCASKIDETAMKVIVRRRVSCENRTWNAWDLNYPAIVVAMEPPVESGKVVEVVARRILTNVGLSSGSYTARVMNPRGVKVAIDPPKLSFKGKGDKQGFRVGFCVDGDSKEKPEGDHVVGWLIWSDGGKYNVTTPLIVKTENVDSSFGI